MARNIRSARGTARDDRRPANVVSPARDVKPRRGERAMPSTGPSWSQLVELLRVGRGRQARATTDKPIVTAGSLPLGLAEQYHAEPGFLRRHIDYYEGDVAARPAFRDRGDKLVAYQVDPTTLASLLAIAQHRQWRELRVTGDRPFRRAVWLEAAAAGLTVRGYRPSARDRDAAAMLEPQVSQPTTRTPELLTPDPVMRGRPAAERPTSQSPTSQSPAPQRPAPQRQTSEPARTFQQGVTGLLVEHGQAPYQNQPAGKPTPFMRVDIGAAKPFEVWGVDFSKALHEAQITRGDAIQLSWHGPDYGDIRVEKAKVADPTSQPERSTPDPSKDAKLKTADAARSSGDPERATAQARLAVVDTVARAKLTHPKDRAQIGAAAKAKLAQHMARGSDFSLPKVAERAVHPTLDLGPVPSRSQAQDRQR